MSALRVPVSLRLGSPTCSIARRCASRRSLRVRGCVPGVTPRRPTLGWQAMLPSHHSRNIQGRGGLTVRTSRASRDALSCRPLEESFHASVQRASGVRASESLHMSLLGTCDADHSSVHNASPAGPDCRHRAPRTISACECVPPTGGLCRTRHGTVVSDSTHEGSRVDTRPQAPERARPSRRPSTRSRRVNTITRGMSLRRLRGPRQ